jgi:hypothetical protein
MTPELEKEYILLDITADLSRLNNSRMWRISWYCVTDNTQWEMIVDESYANFRRSHWDRIVDSDQPWGLYTGLRRTTKKTTSGAAILNADSRPQTIITTTQHEAVISAVRIQDAVSTVAQLTDLFEVDA